MPSRAPRRAMRQSQAMASSSAPPKAAPLSTPITGTGHSAIAAGRPAQAALALLQELGQLLGGALAQVEPGREVALPGARQQHDAGRGRRGALPVGSPGRRGSPRRGRSRAPSLAIRATSASPSSSTRGGGRRARGSLLASVLVMGAGAVGSYYGALLARDGHDVTLVARGAHLDALAGGRAHARARGRRQRGGTPRSPRSPRPRAPAPDLVIVATKSHHTLAAAEALAPWLPRDHGALPAERRGERRPARLGAGRRPGARRHRLRRPARGGAGDGRPRGRGLGADGRPGRAHRAGAGHVRAAVALVGRRASPRTSSTPSGTSCCGTPGSTRSAP